MSFFMHCISMKHTKEIILREPAPPMNKPKLTIPDWHSYKT